MRLRKTKAGSSKGNKISACTDESDYQIKLKSLRKFIDNGDKAKVTLRFREEKWLIRIGIRYAKASGE